MPGLPHHRRLPQKHGKLLKKIFLIFVQACREMKLMDAKTLCLDGTTIRAVNGKKQATSAELSRKKLEYAPRAAGGCGENIWIRWTKTTSTRRGSAIPLR